LPFGPVIAIIGVGFCGWLLVTRTFTQVWILFAIMVAGAVIKFVLRSARED